MKHFLASLLAGFLLLSQTSEAASPPNRRKPAPAPEGRTWVVGGYLPDSPKRKVYVTISGGTITEVSTTKPAGPAAPPLIDTQDLIFPGLIDMHGHLKYNILPLWDLARGQFMNRFEWRSRYAPYKNAVSFNMRPIKGDTVCAAVRWAEVKAITGGSTAIQGIGGDSKCAKDFGVRNIEIPGDLGTEQRVRAMTDMVMPDLVGRVYDRLIAPLIRQGSTYEQAYAQMLESEGVRQWVSRFVNDPRTVAHGLRLLIGTTGGLPLIEAPKEPAKPENETPAALKQYEKDMERYVQEMQAFEAALERLAASARQDFERALPTIRAALAAPPHQMAANKIEKQIEAMRLWIFGEGKEKPGFLASKKQENTAYEFLSKGGVLAVDGGVRRYIGMFELAVRQSALSYLSLPDMLGIVAHVAEGQRQDPYNRSEYRYAREFGLAREGLVMIHAVGLSREDFRHAAENGVSIVWSPFSNLLLYGETLDVEAAQAAGVNIAIGSDWSPTGSKTLLDELRLARRYLLHEGMRGITDKDLVEMATVNAAKAIKRDRVMGRVAQGYLADLLLVKKPPGSNTDPYSALVQASQADVNLVVVGGQPLYGEPAAIQAAARAFGDTRAPETLPRARAGQGRACPFQKALRLPFRSAFDAGLEGKTNAPDMLSVAGLEAELRTKMGAYAAEVRQKTPAQARNLVELDPIFSCEDAKYQQRFDAFIEQELDRNARERAKLRTEAKLVDTWLATGAEGLEDEE